MCLAQGHNTVTPVRLEPAALRSRVKHSTTEQLCSHPLGFFCQITSGLCDFTIQPLLSSMWLAYAESDIYSLYAKLCQGLVRGQISAPSQFKNLLKLPKIVNNFPPIFLLYFWWTFLVNQIKNSKFTEDFLHIFLQTVWCNCECQCYMPQLYTVIFLWFLIILKWGSCSFRQ